MRSVVTMQRAVGAAVSLFTISLFVACGGGAGPGSTVVGGPCNADTQCNQRCYRGGDFGGGMCTVNCRFDGDCPGGSVCIQNGNGICALQCQAPADCQGFGPTWTCAAEDHAGGGQALVCRVP